MPGNVEGEVLFLVPTDSPYVFSSCCTKRFRNWLSSVPVVNHATDTNRSKQVTTANRNKICFFDR